MVNSVFATLLGISIILPLWATAATPELAPKEPTIVKTDGTSIRFITAFEYSGQAVSDVDTFDRLTEEVIRECIPVRDEQSIALAFIDQLRQAIPTDGVANAYFTSNHLRSYLINLGVKQVNNLEACIEYERRLRNELVIKELHAKEFGITIYEHPLQKCEVRTSTGAPLRFRVFPHINNIPPVSAKGPTLIGRVPHGVTDVIISQVYQNWAFVVAKPEAHSRETVGWVSYKYLTNCI